MMSDIEDLRRLVDAATPGPWTLQDGWVRHVDDGALVAQIATDGVAPHVALANGRLIVATRNLLPSLEPASWSPNDVRRLLQLLDAIEYNTRRPGRMGG